MFRLLTLVSSGKAGPRVALCDRISLRSEIPVEAEFALILAQGHPLAPTAIRRPAVSSAPVHVGRDWGQVLHQLQEIQGRGAQVPGLQKARASGGAGRGRQPHIVGSVTAKFPAGVSRAGAPRT